MIYFNDRKSINSHNFPIIKSLRINAAFSYLGTEFHHGYLVLVTHLPICQNPSDKLSILKFLKQKFPQIVMFSLNYDFLF